MYCIVINKIKSIYMLRHMISNINPNDTVSDIKKEYYKIYCKTDTDSFHFCKDINEVRKFLSEYDISL